MFSFVYTENRRETQTWGAPVFRISSLVITEPSGKTVHSESETPPSELTEDQLSQ